MERTFKIEILLPANRIDCFHIKNMIFTVTLLELQDLQIKRIAFRYITGG